MCDGVHCEFGSLPGGELCVEFGSWPGLAPGLAVREDESDLWLFAQNIELQVQLENSKKELAERDEEVGEMRQALAERDREVGEMRQAERVRKVGELRQTGSYS